MQQQQLGEIKLQEAQQGLDERQRLSNYFSGLQTPAVNPDGTAAPQSGVRMPDWGEVMRIAPTTGPGIAKTYNDSLKAQYEAQDKQLAVAQAQNDQRAGLMQSMVDEPSKVRALIEGRMRGLITQAQFDQLKDVPWNDPSWQSYINQSLKTNEFLTQQREQSKFQFEKSLRPFQTTEAATKAAAADRADAANRLAPALAQGPEQFQTALAREKPEIQTQFAGVTSTLDLMQRALTPPQYIEAAGKTIPLPPAVQQQKVEQQAALGLAAEQAKQGFLNQQNEALVQSVMADKTGAVYAALPGEIQKQIAPVLSQRGWAGFAAKPSDTELTKLQDLETAITIARSLKTRITENSGLVGPVSGRLTVLPYANERKKLQADIDLARQKIGKGLEGGVLRKEDEEKYKHILPTMADTPEVAQSKLDQLEQLLTRDAGIYRTSLKGAGRQLPDSTVLPKSAGGGQAAAPPTGGSVVEGKGGQKYIFTGGNPNDKRNYIPVIIQPPPGQ